VNIIAIKSGIPIRIGIIKAGALIILESTYVLFVDDMGVELEKGTLVVVSVQ
jgi:hypothetical protein